MSKFIRKINSLHVATTPLFHLQPTGPTGRPQRQHHVGRGESNEPRGRDEPSSEAPERQIPHQEGLILMSCAARADRLYDGSVGAPYTLCCSHGFVCGDGGRRGQRWGLRGRCVDSCTTSSGASPPLTPSLYRLCGDVGTHYSLCCSHDFVCAGGGGEGSRG